MTNRSREERLDELQVQCREPSMKDVARRRKTGIALLVDEWRALCDAFFWYWAMFLSYAMVYAGMVTSNPTTTVIGATGATVLPLALIWRGDNE